MRAIWGILAIVVLLPSAWADEDLDSARAHFKKGTAAYALGHYADAATEYETAFSLAPDPALLYNAAQAHRLAGNKERALQLYGNYVRLYGAQVPNVEEARRHIAELKAAIESQQKATTSPSTAILTPKGTPPDKAPPEHAQTAPNAHSQAQSQAQPAPNQQSPAQSSNQQPPAQRAPNQQAQTTQTQSTGATTLTTSAPPPKKPLVKQPWFWATIGGAVVVVAGVAIAVGVVTANHDPAATFGKVSF